MLIQCWFKLSEPAGEQSTNAEEIIQQINIIYAVYVPKSVHWMLYMEGKIHIENSVLEHIQVHTP